MVNPSVDRLRIVLASRRIYALGWIHLHDDPPATAGGLLDANGAEKPGYLAFKNG